MPPTIDLTQFRHRHPQRVRSFDADRQNVMHNLRYFYSFEEARVEYVRAIGMRVDAGTFITRDRFYVARNTCDYAAPAFFDDAFDVLTRIVRVGESSITFAHAAVRLADGALLCSGEHVLVHVDAATDRPAGVPDALRSLIRAYEGANVDMA